MSATKLAVRLWPFTTRNQGAKISRRNWIAVFREKIWRGPGYEKLFLRLNGAVRNIRHWRYLSFLQSRGIRDFMHNNARSYVQ